MGGGEVFGYSSLERCLKFKDIGSVLKAFDKMPDWAKGKHQIAAISYTGTYWSVERYLLRISRAAIKFHEIGKPKEWKIYTGFHHADILRQMKSEGIVFDKTDYRQGFITNEGNMHFVTRREAAGIAYCAKQIKERKSQLFSEDLWT